MEDDTTNIQLQRDEYFKSPEAINFAAKMHGGYIAFIAALLLALVSGGGYIKTDGVAICFLILSLPPLVALFLLDRIVLVLQKRKVSASRGFMALMGYGLSTLGVTSILWHFSVIAAISYLIIIPVCCLIVEEVAGLGWYDAFKEF